MQLHALQFFRSVLIGALACLALVATAQEPTEAQMREEYGRWVLTLGSYEYRARHIMVTTEEAATGLLRELQAGASFAKLASEQSADTGTKNKGGDLGWVRPNDFVPRFRVAFRNMETGLYPRPIQTEFGWHLVEVQEARQLRVPRFEEVSAQIAQRLRQRDTQAAPRSRPTTDWQTLFVAALQTAGHNSYEYAEAASGDFEEAKRISRFGIVGVHRQSSTTLKARHLVDVPPQYRFAITNLYVAGDTTPPLESTLPNGSKRWTVLQLIKRGKAIQPAAGAEFERDAERWIAEGKLLDVAALRSPFETAKTEYWRNFRLADLGKVDPSLSADLTYDNQSTPLLDAILGDQMELAKRLVQRGASVHRCGSWGCPIAVASSLESEPKALAWVDWLLSLGAKPDQMDSRDPDRSSTALALALFAGHNAVADRLLSAGANVNGMPDASLTPAEAAASKLNKPMVEKLVAMGASVMPRLPSRGVFGMRSIYSMTLTDEGTSLRPWAEKIILQQASAHPEYRLSVQLEQNGRLVPINTNGPTVLKAAPFKLIFGIPDGSDGVQIGASFERAWVEEIKRIDPRNSMFRPMSSGALQETDKPKSAYVLISRPCAKPSSEQGAETGCDEGYAMHLNTDPKSRKDFHSVRPGSPRSGLKQYVRDVDHFAGIVDSGTSPTTDRDAPISEMKGKMVYFVAGIPVNIGGDAGLRLVNPQYFQLKFQ
jgi:hypothetical protein